MSIEENSRAVILRKNHNFPQCLPINLGYKILQKLSNLSIADYIAYLCKEYYSMIYFVGMGLLVCSMSDDINVSPLNIMKIFQNISN